MPLSPFSLPVPLGDGESAISLLTTAGSTIAGDATVGTLLVGASTGEIDRWDSGISIAEDGPGSLTWSTLAALPFSQSIVTKIYAAGLITAQASGSTGVLGFKYVRDGGSGPSFTLTNSTVPSGQFSALLASGSGATTLDLSSITFKFTNRATLHTLLTPPGDRTVVSAIGVVVYYMPSATPPIPIGHGANCNNYGPIGLANGANSAPGNGPLIDI